MVLDERPDRPLSLLESVRILQDTLVQEYDPQAALVVDEIAERKKQVDRERCAHRTVFAESRKRTEAPAEALNEYVKQTKAILDESYARMPSEKIFTVSCTLSYRSILRTITDVEALGSSKKEAKRASAVSLLARLKQETSLHNNCTYSSIM
jgi:dsRNA-specific ribonuclease